MSYRVEGSGHVLVGALAAAFRPDPNVENLGLANLLATCTANPIPVVLLYNNPTELTGAAMGSPQPVRRIDDPSVLKAMAHPLRQRLFRVLAQLGPATVGGLASHVDGDPGRVSYHLRELAKGGFIEQAPELSQDRRETWWRAVERSTEWSSDDFPTPDGAAIYDAVVEQMHADQFNRVRRFVTTADQWDPAWQQAAISSQSMLQLTAEELSELASELQPIFERWAEVGRRARDAGDTEGREPVLLFLHAFPDRP